MRAIVFIAFALLLAGCGSAARPKPVPDLRGQRLDLAEDRLAARGLDWEEVGGGNLGIVVRSHWYVCTQEPAPGKKTTRVRLVVERGCSSPVSRPVVPGVVGMNLDAAEETLDGVGIGYDAETSDGDTPLVEHLWEVCSQDPLAGTHESFVELYVARGCD